MRHLTLLLTMACTGSQTVTHALPQPTLQLVGTHALPSQTSVELKDGAYVLGAQVPMFGDAPLADVPVLEADLITPGFVDAHAHPIGLGRALSEVDLVGVPTYADALAKVEAAARDGNGWLLGRGWDQNDWPDAPAGGWPLAADLDRIVSDRPVVLRRIDGHASWANTAALTASGVSSATSDPAGGRILRTADGAPSGVLVDTATDLLDVPEPTDAQVEAWLRAAQDAMLAAGLAGVHDMGVDDATLAAYRRIEDAGDLKIRVQAYLTPDSEAAKRLLAVGPERGKHLSIVGIKAYADGALGSRGAHLSAPYHDEPDTSGLVITDKAALTALATSCLKARAQLAVHAIGDQAVTDTLDAFAAARQAAPDSEDVWLRVEHAQVVRPEDRARFAPLHAVASMQPTHATSDMPWAEDRLGPERIGWAYTWRALAEADAPLLLGSDFPVEGVEPANGIWAATTRTALDGTPEGGWHPDQRLTLEETIAGFTVLPGLVSGNHAVHAPDLTAWTRIDGPPGWRPVATIIDGELAWSAEGVAPRSPEGSAP